MHDRGRGSPFDHECANPAVGEDLQGMAVVMRQRLTPQSLAYSIDYRADIGYRADRRHSTVPNNSLALRLAFAPLGAVRLLGREGLSHELHRVRNLAGVIHLQLDVAVAPEPEIGDVGGKPARVGDVVEAHVEAEQEPALLRHDVCEVGLRLVGDIVPRELFADLRREARISCLTASKRSCIGAPGRRCG